jgi:hypothetical protein
VTTLTTEDRFALWLGRATIAKGHADTARQAALDALRSADRAIRDERDPDAIDAVLATIGDSVARYQQQRAKLANALAKAEETEQRMRDEANPPPAAPASGFPPPAPDPIITVVHPAVNKIDAMYAAEAAAARSASDAATIITVVDPAAAANAAAMDEIQRLIALERDALADAEEREANPHALTDEDLAAVFAAEAALVAAAAEAELTLEEEELL